MVDFIDWFSTYNMVSIGLTLKMVIGSVDKFTKKAKKNFALLAKEYGLLCRNLVENQKQRIDYWEKEGNKKIK